MMFSNSDGFSSRPLAVIGYSNARFCPGGSGKAPTLPAAAWRFSDWIAAITSLGPIELAGHPVRVEPDPHRVLPPEDRDVAHPGNPPQDVGDGRLAVVVEERSRRSDRRARPG